MYRSGLGKTNLHGADSEIGHRAGHLLGLWLWIWWLAGWTLLASSTPSPLDLHQEVRQLVVDQSDPRPLVEEWLKATGDHSFEAFQSPSGRLREALVLQAAAAELWDEERYGQAGGLYSRARRMLESTGAWSEVAFCFYYQAEILSEQEQWAESAVSVHAAQHARFEQAYVNLGSGFIFTIYAAASEAALIEQFEELGLPYDEIHEVQFSQSFAQMEQMLQQMGRLP